MGAPRSCIEVDYHHYDIRVMVMMMLMMAYTDDDGFTSIDGIDGTDSEKIEDNENNSDNDCDDNDGFYDSADHIDDVDGYGSDVDNNYGGSVHVANNDDADAASDDGATMCFSLFCCFVFFTAFN